MLNLNLEAKYRQSENARNIKAAIILRNTGKAQAKIKQELSNFGAGRGI
jgi:hypothetical protein